MEKHWMVEKTSHLNQYVHFKDVLTSEWEPGYVLYCNRRRKDTDTIKLDKY